MSQNNTRRRCGVFGISFAIFSLAFLAPCLRAHAQPVTATATEKEELLLYFSEEETVATATKQALPVSKVPAVATVITAEQIRNMGARTLVEAIGIAPGIGIWQDFVFGPEIEIRGARTWGSNKVLVLLDGNRLNNHATGGATLFFSDIPLDNVKRIEIIRGPVSALYGANAFAGLINIITKEGNDINGVDARVGGGSWSTQRYSLQAGKKFGGLQVAGHFNYLESDGFRGDVQKDADPTLTSAAPGKTDIWRRRMDAGFTASYKDLRLEYLHMHKAFGPYVGAAWALNDESQTTLTSDLGELSYRFAPLKGLNVSARVYGKQDRYDADFELLSEGFDIGTGAFPDGVQGNPRMKERSYGAEVQVDYEPFKDNLITFGLNLEKVRQLDVQHWTNFRMILIGNAAVPVAIGPFQDVTAWQNWNENVHRNIKAWYLQDSWNITDKLNLIAGVRHDEYSDFGKTTNPRAGLVWEARKDTHIKLLAGRAFRAPAFDELYNRNNPSVVGNPDLDPEIITTTEFSVETRVVKQATMRVSYFKNYTRDIIATRFLPGSGFQFANGGRSRVAGLEAEARYDVNRTDYLYANLTWLEPKRLGSGGEIVDIPKWRSNIGGNVAFARWFNFNTNIFISGDRPRAAGDWRKDIPSYAVIDAALTFRNFWKGLEIQLLARNLLDKRYDDPAPVDKVPGDFPRDGREIFLEARYTF